MSPPRSRRLACLGALLCSGLAAAEGPAGIDRDEALRASQAAVGREVSGAYRFTDTEGRQFALSSLRGSPVVVSFVYTSCYHTCPLITEHLAPPRTGRSRRCLGNRRPPRQP